MPLDAILFEPVKMKDCLQSANQATTYASDSAQPISNPGDSTANYGTINIPAEKILFVAEIPKQGGLNVKLMENAMDVVPGKRNFTAEQWTLFAMFAIINFGAAAILSIQAPFYPAEAEKKGASATEYGLVFGIYELVIFIVSPIYGKYMVNIGPKFLLNAGIFVNSISCILFGFLDKVPGKSEFLALSFIIRIIQGMGQAGYLTSCFALVAQTFPGRADTTFTNIQAFFGIGVIVGPTLGGALYQVGGFILPFAASGGMLFIAACITFYLLNTTNQGNCSRKGKPPSILAVLRMPAALISIYTTFCGACSMGFLAATLEPHLRQFQLTPVLTGLMFVVSGGTFAIATPIWGQIFKRIRKSKLICGMAATSVCISFTLLGPAPYMPFNTALWICIVALVFQGIGVGGEVITGLIGSLYEVKANGFPDNLQTYGLMSSLWGSAFALGAFVGPTIGGMLLDLIGFRMGTLFVIAQHGLLAVINFGYLLYASRKTGTYLEIVPESEEEEEALIKYDTNESAKESKKMEAT